MINRRALVRILAATPFACSSRLARAQGIGHPVKIGYLGSGSGTASWDRIRALQSGLLELGWIEGKNIVYEIRLADDVAQLKTFADELASMQVDVICVTSSTETEAARQATATIPIVFSNHADPVGTGHVSSLSRPERNITGTSIVMTEVTGKSLELLTLVSPESQKIGVLLTSTAPSKIPTYHAVADASSVLGKPVQFAEVQAVGEFESAFRIFAEQGVGSVLVPATSLTVRGGGSPESLARLALKYRMPSMFGARENVVAGGLMSYSPNQNDLGRRAAGFVDRLLKGEKPASLPVEQATRFDLVINARSAQALGVTLPAKVLAFAVEVIE